MNGETLVRGRSWALDPKAESLNLAAVIRDGAVTTRLAPRSLGTLRSESGTDLLDQGQRGAGSRVDCLFETCDPASSLEHQAVTVGRLQCDSYPEARHQTRDEQLLTLTFLLQIQCWIST